jgi:hypothetical protein
MIPQSRRPTAASCSPGGIASFGRLPGLDRSKLHLNLPNNANSTCTAVVTDVSIFSQFFLKRWEPWMPHREYFTPEAGFAFFGFWSVPHVVKNKWKGRPVLRSATSLGHFSFPRPLASLTTSHPPRSILLSPQPSSTPPSPSPYRLTNNQPQYTRLCPILNSTILLVPHLYPLPIPNALVPIVLRHHQPARYPITIIMGLSLMLPPYTPLQIPTTTAATAAACVILPTNTLARRRLHNALLSATRGPQQAGTMAKAPRLLSPSTTVVRLVSSIHLACDGLVSATPIPPNAVPLAPSHPPLLFIRRLTISVLCPLPRFVPAQTVRCFTKRQYV